jgi:hypothetical protein
MRSAITVEPHTTVIFQVMVVAFFGVLKREPLDELPFENDQAIVTFMMKRADNFPGVWL